MKPREPQPPRVGHAPGCEGGDGGQCWLAHNGIETDAARLQLRNVLALARRLKRNLGRGVAVTDADLDHFIRFAANANVMPTVLRATKAVKP